MGTAPILEPMPVMNSPLPATGMSSAWRGGVRVAVFSLGLWLAGCATVPTEPAYVPTGDPVADGNARMAAAPVQDRPLWACRLGLEALRRGDWTDARAKLDEAILAQGGIMGPRADAERARSKFHREREKLFVGEPYERVMAYFYRAILYWMDGEPDNARACYRTAQLLDSDAATAAYKSDWVLPDYLDALASARMSADWADALLRAQQDFRGTLPPMDPESNVLVFVELGRGPVKYAGGEYGERLYFQPGTSLARTAVLQVAGRTLRIGTQDDITFQATTRGGRAMDLILEDKADFKETTDAVGDLSLVGAAISASQPRRHRNDELTLGLAAVGLLSKITSAATTPEADTRCWNNLPQWLGFVALRLPPGDYPASVEFRSADGQAVPGSPRQFTLQVKPAPGDTVLILSELTP